MAFKTSAFVRPSRSTEVLVAHDANASMQTKAKAEPFKIFLSHVMSIKEWLKNDQAHLAIISLMANMSYG